MKKKTITVPKEVADRIEKAIDWKIGDNEDARLTEDETITYTARFDDGVEVDIKCCGCEVDEFLEENGAWTEAVMFKDGCEVACSDVEEEFFGEWELFHGKEKYCVDVVIGE